MRYRLLNRFKYIDQPQNIQESESYLAILTSAIQENIKAETSRGLIFELSNSEEIINNSIYNSIEFDIAGAVPKHTEINRRRYFIMRENYKIIYYDSFNFQFEF